MRQGRPACARSRAGAGQQQRPCRRLRSRATSRPPRRSALCPPRRRARRVPARPGPPSSCRRPRPPSSQPAPLTTRAPPAGPTDQPPQGQQPVPDPHHDAGSQDHGRAQQAGGDVGHRQQVGRSATQGAVGTSCVATPTAATSPAASERPREDPKHLVGEVRRVHLVQEQPVDVAETLQAPSDNARTSPGSRPNTDNLGWAENADRALDRDAWGGPVAVLGAFDVVVAHLAADHPGVGS